MLVFFIDYLLNSTLFVIFSGKKFFGVQIVFSVYRVNVLSLYRE